MEPQGKSRGDKYIPQKITLACMHNYDIAVKNVYNLENCCAEGKAD